MTAAKAMMPERMPSEAKPVGVAPARQPPGRNREASQRAERQRSGEPGGLADAQAEHLAAEGLEQNVLHAEGRGAEAHAPPAVAWHGPPR